MTADGMASMQAQALMRLPVFSGLRIDQLQRLAPCLRPVQYAAGDTVFAAGEPARQLFILLAGEIAIHFHPYDGTDIEIATARADDAVGWSAVLRHAACTSTAICKTDVQALAIQAADLRRLMAADADLGTRLIENISQVAANRIESLGREVIRRLQTSGDLPAGPSQPKSSR